MKSKSPIGVPWADISFDQSISKTNYDFETLTPFLPRIEVRVALDIHNIY